MALVTLSGNDVYAGEIVWPFAGLWHADLFCTLAIDTSGPQVLNFAGTPWTCAVVRAIDWTGGRGVRVVGGLGGWRTKIPAKQYGNGVIATQHVLADAAAACGEAPPVVAPTVPPTVGSSYLRPADIASWVLQDVLDDGWYLDSSGTVQTAPRPATSIATPFDVLAVAGAAGRYLIGTESPGDWLPGATFVGLTASGAISRTMHMLREGSIRTEVLAS